MIGTQEHVHRIQDSQGCHTTRAACQTPRAMREAGFGIRVDMWCQQCLLGVWCQQLPGPPSGRPALGCHDHSCDGCWVGS